MKINKQFLLMGFAFLVLLVCAGGVFAGQGSVPYVDSGGNNNYEVNVNVGGDVLGQMLILGDIGGYVLLDYFEADDVSGYGLEGFNSAYIAEYRKDNYIFSLIVLDLDYSAMQELEDEIAREDIELVDFNGDNIYIIEAEPLQFVFWMHNNFAIYEVSVPLSSIEDWSGLRSEFPELIVEKYLEKYPSDLEAEEVVYFAGDLNKNGKLDEGDVNMFVDYLWKGVDEIENADLNGDNEINVADLTMIVDVVYGRFLQGDVNGDGKVDGDDVEFLTAYLWEGGPEPEPIFRGNVNELYGPYGPVDVADLVFLIDMIDWQEDANAPVITLYNPDDGDEFKTSKNEKEITFEFKVEDESEIDFCELIIEWDVEETLDNPERNAHLEFEHELGSDEKYDWRIRCVDVHGNSGFSETWDFEIVEKDSNNNKDDYFNLLNYQNNDEEDEFSGLTNQGDTISLGDVDEDDGEGLNILWILILPFLLLGIIVLLILISVFKK